MQTIFNLNRIKILITICAVIFLGGFANGAFAASCCCTTAAPINCTWDAARSGCPVGLSDTTARSSEECAVHTYQRSQPSPSEQAPTAAPSTQLDNPLTGKPAGIPIKELAGNIIKTVLGLVGILALIYIIIGGVKWMTSSGNPEKVKEGRDTLLWAVLGLALIMFSYIILNFVISVLGRGVSN